MVQSLETSHRWNWMVYLNRLAECRHRSGVILLDEHSRFSAFLFFSFLLILFYLILLCYFSFSLSVYYVYPGLCADVCFFSPLPLLLVPFPVILHTLTPPGSIPYPNCTISPSALDLAVFHRVRLPYFSDFIPPLWCLSARFLVQICVCMVSLGWRGLLWHFGGVRCVVFVLHYALGSCCFFSAVVSNFLLTASSAVLACALRISHFGLVPLC